MIWHFQDFELDDDRFELRRGGEHIPIAPKPLALLLHLAKRHPASVSREELFRALWPGVRVTGASLARAVLAARHAIGEAGRDDGAIRTIRGRGYALSDACTPEAAPSPFGASGLDAPFVGRGGELACIETALDHAEVGRGRLLFITGEPGIGKSRLLEELTARARVRGAVVIAGHCREDEGAPPYWPWSEILRALLTACEDPLRSAVESLIVDLAPHRAEHPGADPAGGFSVDADARFQLFHRITDVLRQAAGGRLVVVAIEDLHWAGPGSLYLLRFAGRSLANASVLIAMTYRSAGPPPNPALEATSGELGALSHAVPELRLAAFSSDEVAAYVRNVTGQPPDADLVRRLQDAAGGNPLFLRELVPILAPSDAAKQRARTAVPTSINHVVRSQVARLSRPARALVEIASVNGRGFAPQLLARVSGRRVETVLERLDEARAENLIERDRSGGFRFRHDIIRAALFEGLRPARRIELHWRVARALEAGARLEPQLAEIAHHFFEARPRIGSEKAIHYATRAAEAARRALDFDGAAHHYRQALAALDERPAATASERCDLLLQLGEVLELAGQLTRSREAILEAATLARELRSFTRLGRAALAMTAWQQLRLADPVAVHLVEEALRAVGRRPLALRARLLARLAMARSVAGDAAAAGRLLDEAFTLAKRRNDPALRCDVLVEKLSILQRQVSGDHAVRLNLTAELLDVATRAERVYAVLQCRRHRLALFLESGAGADLDEEIEHFTRESTAARRKPHYVAAFRAMRALVSGRFEEANRAIDEAESLADPLSPEERRFTPAAQRLNLPPEYRDTEALVGAIAQIIRDFPQVTPWRGAHALAALDVGRTQVARAEIDLLAADDFALVPHDLSYVVTLSALTEVSWRLREPRYAARLYELLRPHAGAQVAVGVGMAYQGPVDWFLGVLATLLGRRQDAARRFQVALTTTERLGAWPWHARTELTYAELLATGSATERRRAQTLAASAANAATRLRMDTLRGDAEQLLATLARTRRGVAR